MSEHTETSPTPQPPIGVDLSGNVKPHDTRRTVIIVLVVLALLGLCLCATFTASLIWFQRAVTRDRLAIDWDADPDWVPNPVPMPEIDPLPETTPYPTQPDGYPENVLEARIDEQIMVGGVYFSATRAATEVPLVEFMIENLSDSEVRITTWGARDLAGNGLAYHELTGAVIPEGGILAPGKAYDFSVMFRTTTNDVSDFSQVVLHLGAPLEGYHAIVFK